MKYLARARYSTEHLLYTCQGTVVDQILQSNLAYVPAKLPTWFGVASPALAGRLDVQVRLSIGLESRGTECLSGLEPQGLRLSRIREKHFSTLREIRQLRLDKFFFLKNLHFLFFIPFAGDIIMPASHRPKGDWKTL